MAMQQKTLGRRVLFDHLIGACKYRWRHSRRTVRTDIRGRSERGLESGCWGFVLNEGGVSAETVCVECSDRSWPVTDGRLNDSLDVPQEFVELTLRGASPQ